VRLLAGDPSASTQLVNRAGVTQRTPSASPRPVTATGPPESDDPLEDPIARSFFFLRIYLQTEGLVVMF
jgi:hypothetical protein